MSGGHAPDGEPVRIGVPFRVDARLLRAILSAIAFYCHDSLHDEDLAELRDPPDTLIDTLSDLVAIRLEVTDG